MRKSALYDMLYRGFQQSTNNHILNQLGVQNFYKYIETIFTKSYKVESLALVKVNTNQQILKESDMVNSLNSQKA